MKKLLLLLPLAVLLPACKHVPSRAECTTHGGGAWTEVKTAHFRVYTNLDAEEATEAALDLERARKALLFAWDFKIDPPGRVDTVLLQSDTQLEEFAHKNVAGFVSDRGEGPLIVMPGGPDDLENDIEARTVLVHELAHHLSRFVLIRQPRWFAEGLASYLETTRPYGDGSEARMGEVNYRRLSTVRKHGRMSFEDLWKWDELRLDGQAALNAHYASAWLWVHFLMNKHPRRLADFQARLARAEEPQLAWALAFSDIKQEELDRELNVYLRQGNYSAFRFPMPQVDGAVATRPMSPAEVHVLRARLLWVGPRDAAASERRQQRDAELAMALELDPTSFEALHVRAEAAQSPKDRAALARALTVSHPDRADGWMLLAQSLFDDPAASAERREAAVKAVQLEPDRTQALNILAWDYVITGNPRIALPFAGKAARMAPFNPAVLDTFAAALAGTGRCDEAVELQRRAVEVLSEFASEAEHAHYRSKLSEYQNTCQPGAPK